MSHLDKDYQQQEHCLGHVYTHKKFNSVYTHKKLGLCFRQREQENKENRLKCVSKHKPIEGIFRPYDLGANTPRRRRISRCFESNQLQPSSQSCESNEGNYIPAISTSQSSLLSLEISKQNSKPSMYIQQSSTRFCETVKENYQPNTYTPQSSSSSYCDPTEENYAPQSPASSCESLKENDNTSIYTPQSSPSTCETSSPLSCESPEENGPQSHEPAKQNNIPQSSDFVKENSTSSKSLRPSLARSCKSKRGNYTPPIYTRQSSSPRAVENGNMPAESKNSNILRLQRLRAARYLHYFSQYQQLLAMNPRTPMGYPMDYPMGYPNVTAPIFNGY